MVRLGTGVRMESSAQSKDPLRAIMAEDVGARRIQS